MEIDNFSYSHRCTSTVRLWSGARSVCQHRRVPLRHFLRFFRPPLPQKCSVLYFLTCSTSSWVQEANTEFAQSPCSWSRNLLLTHPAMKSVPTDPNQLRDFSGRVSLHFISYDPYDLSSTKSHPPGMISMPGRSPGRVSIACQIEGTKTPKCWLLVGRTSALRTVVRPAAIASLP